MRGNEDGGLGGLLRARALGVAMCALAVGVGVVGVAQSAGGREIRVGLHDAAPVIQVAADGEPTGIGVAVLKHIAAAQGWRLTWVPGSWSDLLHKLQAGELDLLLPVAKTQERAGSLAFSHQTIHATWGQLFVTQGRRLDSLLGLAGKRVAVVRDDVFGAALRALLGRFDVAASWVETASLAEAAREVAEGRADAVALQRFSDPGELDEMGLVDTPVVFHPTAGRFAAPPAQAALLSAIDRGLGALKEDSGSIYHQELSRLLGPKQPEARLSWLWLALGIAVFVAVSLALFSALLRRRVRTATDEVGRLNEDLERRVFRRTAELKQANEDLESFTYTVSHDLRSPLRTMQGFLKLLENRYGEGMEEEAKSLLGRALHGAERMDGLIDALLKLSRASRRDLTLHEVDVQVLLDELVAEVVARTTAAGGRAPEVEIAEDLPGALADGGMLRQLFQNLLDNAVKYSSDRDRPRVWIEGERTDDAVVYRVKDNGVGFDPKFKDDLFKVFRRLHPQSEFEGAGVGLALVARIVRRHGGTVTAESPEGDGATFEVSLPFGSPTNQDG